ncbi:hypothetical protein SAMN05216490_2842 [Mucilaginibacter mallensis]|uniref:Phosphonoacetaldehyde hydrolase n=1 Tax=Mucilaginibacter mallensis TaxID=652787 RepID=A0A1H1YT60_MUCMA|nr:hypothetical protein SAMN05216490_2842 [Mucilaginibacter mallensis]
MLIKLIVFDMAGTTVGDENHPTHLIDYISEVILIIRQC